MQALKEIESRRLPTVSDKMHWQMAAPIGSLSEVDEVTLTAREGDFGVSTGSELAIMLNLRARNPGGKNLTCDWKCYDVRTGPPTFCVWRIVMHAVPPPPSGKPWRELYRAALFENDAAKLPGRIADAEKAIALRARELFQQATGDHIEEEYAMDDALCGLHALRSAHRDAGAKAKARPD